MNQWNADTKEPEHEAQQVDETDTAGRREHTELKVLCGADDPAPIREEERTEGAERQKDRLRHNAGVHLLEDVGDTAKRQSFERRVEGRRVRRPDRLEGGDHGDNEATNHPAPHPEHRQLSLGALAPHIHRGHEQHDQ